MNTLTDINAHLFPITDGGNTYADMAAYAYAMAVTGASVTMRCGLSFMASRLIPALNEVASETALIVRLDVRETSGGHVWTIYWQEPGDGEA